MQLITPDKFHDECAVFGIYGHKEAANLTYLGLYALQHRGQEGSGIVSSDGDHFYTEKGMGLSGGHLYQVRAQTPAGQHGHRTQSLFHGRRK